MGVKFEMEWKAKSYVLLMSLQNIGRKVPNMPILRRKSLSVTRTFQGEESQKKTFRDIKRFRQAKNVRPKSPYVIIIIIIIIHTRICQRYWPAVVSVSLIGRVAAGPAGRPGKPP